MRILFFILLFSAVLIGGIYMLEPRGGGIAKRTGVSAKEPKVLKHLPKL